LVSPEAYPYAKAGGMGDVVGALFKYLPRRGIKTRLFVPGYPGLFDYPLKAMEKDVDFLFGETPIKASFYQLELGPQQSLIAVCNDRFFNREHIYGYQDDIERFIFFSRAIFEYLVRTQEEEFILHCHDWQSALLCAYIKIYWPPYRGKPAKTIFTIHNLAYQGIGKSDLLRLLNLPYNFFSHEYLEYYGNLNLLKAGLIFADIVTTVSPTYAKEITSPEFGEGLDGLIRALASKKRFVGIVNGIDIEEYNPQSDSSLVKGFSSNNLEGKLENKRHFLKDFFNWKVDTDFESKPLLTMIARLVRQKGSELILAQPDSFFQIPAFWFFLGTGEEIYEMGLKELEKRYSNVRVEIRFDEQLARLAYGASDIFVMPSRFEPCGISQLIAMRYGSIPVARKVGGLADTIVDYPFNPRLNTGFHFYEYKTEELLKTVQRAFEIYRHNKDLWKLIIKNAMESDFSWDKAIDKYVELYYSS
jgi:starch synthase